MPCQPLLKSVRAKLTMFLSLTVMILATVPAFSQTFTSLLSFNVMDGYNPNSYLVQGRDGNLYGVTFFGTGANGKGTIFKITPGGTLTTLHRFSGGADGSFPVSGLVLDIDGNFYGTTTGGGATNEGVVFKMAPDGTVTGLASFVHTGGLLISSLVLGTDGRLYGTTFGGGANKEGSIFAVSHGGTLRTIYNFSSTGGQFPDGSLVVGTDGNFYGTTAVDSTNRAGTVFKVTPDGILTTLHTFDNTDGSDLIGPLTLGNDGNFYGTTCQGGSNNEGTIFEITPTGTFTSLLTFSVKPDGSCPTGLALGTDGNFYGTTTEGGVGSDGTLYQFAPPGTFTILHSFDGTDGSAPQNPLTQHTNGTFYGMTADGGLNKGNGGLGDGTVFSEDTGAGPFIGLVRNFGMLGSTVQILGQGLTGTTAVAFNGTPALTFTVVADTYMTAVVPAGATSGPVTVTTPGGTLTSNRKFMVQ